MPPASPGRGGACEGPLAFWVRQFSGVAFVLARLHSESWHSCEPARILSVELSEVAPVRARSHFGRRGIVPAGPFAFYARGISNVPLV